MVAVSTLLNRLLQIVAYVASMSRDEPPWISRRLKLNHARLDSMKSRLLPAVSCQEELSPGVVEFARDCVEMNGFGLLLASSDLKAVERFSTKDVNGVLVATDVAARGLDIPGIRTVIHYQLPHSADVYIHRSGRTARASSDGCSIALISPKDKAKFISLCKSMKKETLRQFPLEESYLPEVMKRMSLARQLDKISRKNTQENVKKNWLKRSAESLELTLEESGSEEETVTAYKQKRAKSVQLKNLQQELNFLLAQPLQPRTFSRRYLLGAGISFDLPKQLEQLSNIKEAEKMNPKEKQKPNFAVFGQQCIEPLQALRNSGHEVLPSRLYHIPALRGERMYLLSRLSQSF